MKKLTVGLAMLVLSLLAARVALADARFTDPAGDASSAPDVTAVTAANDGAGNLTFTVTTNQPALPAGMALGIFFNTDKNRSTGGSGDGVEFILFVVASGWEFRRWDGTQFATATAPSANATYANGVLTFKVNKSDITGVNTFFFWVESAQFDAAAEIVASDVAPDGTAVYDYTLTVPAPATPPLTLRASAPVAVPARPAAGKAFAVRVPVVRGDTGAALARASPPARSRSA